MLTTEREDNPPFSPSIGRFVAVRLVPMPPPVAKTVCEENEGVRGTCWASLAESGEVRANLTAIKRTFQTVTDGDTYGAWFQDRRTHAASNPYCRIRRRQRFVSGLGLYSPAAARSFGAHLQNIVGWRFSNSV